MSAVAAQMPLQSTSISLAEQPRALGRFCNATGCERPARRRGRFCGRCALRQWRAANRDRDRARESKRTFSDEQRLIRSARATVAMAVKRGHVKAQACRDCGRIGRPHHPDPRQPRNVLWLCRSHRLIEREREQEARRTQAEREIASAREEKWCNLVARFTAAWPLLPADAASSIQALAQQNPLIRSLHPEAPLARQALIRAYGVWCGDD